MVDILPAVAKQLEGIARVELAMPDAAEKYPVITLSEISSTAEVILSGAERLSTVAIQVDVWDKQPDPRTVVKMAKAVSEKLTACGLTRFFGQLIFEGGNIQRKCMRFNCSVDEVSELIFKA